MDEGEKNRTASAPQSWRGSCLCGAVAFELTARPSAFSYCHCSSCRKASGSAFGASATVARADFRLLAPADTLTEYESSPGKLRAFCSRCGSPVHARMADRPDTLRIRMGLIDSRFDTRPQAHIWTSEAPAWDRICDDVPQFPRFPPR